MISAVSTLILFSKFWLQTAFKMFCNSSRFIRDGLLGRPNKSFIFQIEVSQNFSVASNEAEKKVFLGSAPRLRKTEKSIKDLCIRRNEFDKAIVRQSKP